MHYDPIGSTDGFVGREELNGSVYLTQCCIRIHNFVFIEVCCHIAALDVQFGPIPHVWLHTGFLKL